MTFHGVGVWIFSGITHWVRKLKIKMTGYNLSERIGTVSGITMNLGSLSKFLTVTSMWGDSPPTPPTRAARQRIIIVEPDITEC